MGSVEVDRGSIVWREGLFSRRMAIIARTGSRDVTATINTWSDAAREAAIESRRANPKAVKAQGHVGKLTGKTHVQFGTILHEVKFTEGPNKGKSRYLPAAELGLSDPIKAGGNAPDGLDKHRADLLALAKAHDDKFSNFGYTVKDVTPAGYGPDSPDPHASHANRIGLRVDPVERQKLVNQINDQTIWLRGKMNPDARKRESVALDRMRAKLSQLDSFQAPHAWSNGIVSFHPQPGKPTKNAMPTLTTGSRGIAVTANTWTDAAREASAESRRLHGIYEKSAATAKASSIRAASSEAIASASGDPTDKAHSDALADHHLAEADHHDAAKIAKIAGLPDASASHRAVAAEHKEKHQAYQKAFNISKPATSVVAPAIPQPSHGKIYDVGGRGFNSFLEATAHAQSIRGNVVESKNGMVRWTPPAAPSKKQMYEYAGKLNYYRASVDLPQTGKPLSAEEKKHVRLTRNEMPTLTTGSRGTVVTTNEDKSVDLVKVAKDKQATAEAAHTQAEMEAKAVEALAIAKQATTEANGRSDKAFSLKPNSPAGRKAHQAAAMAHADAKSHWAKQAGPQSGNDLDARAKAKRQSDAHGQQEKKHTAMCQGTGVLAGQSTMNTGTRGVVCRVRSNSNG